MRFKPLFLTVFLSTQITQMASASIYAVWDKEPINVPLNLNKERIVTVEGLRLQVGLPASLESVVSTQSVGHSVYFKASKAFEKTRVQLRDIATGKIVLLNLSASDKGKDFEYQDIQIGVADGTTTKNTTGTKVPAFKATNSTSSSEEHITRQLSLPAPAALTRYASQSLYAPIRAIEPLDGVYRVAFKLPKNLSHILPSLPIHATPLVSFGLGDYVVTAIKVKNLSYEKISLDPRFLQGKYIAATFQHNFLGRRGSQDDTTVVYLITVGKLTKEMLY